MPAELRDICGTVIAVTGSGSGIGFATADLLLEAGARVVLGDVSVERVTPLVEKWGDDFALAVGMDVRSAEDAGHLVAAGRERWGRFDSLVANAGVGFFGGILDWSVAEIDAMLQVNVAGTVLPIRAAVQHFTEVGGGGDIVIVSSVAGLGSGGPMEAVYAATKFAQVGLAISLDKEVRPHGVRITTIAPAAVNTAFAMGTGRVAGDPALSDYLDPSDVGNAIVTVLRQPRRMRTALWTMWSMAEENP